MNTLKLFLYGFSQFRDTLDIEILGEIIVYLGKYPVVNLFYLYGKADRFSGGLLYQEIFRVGN